MWFDSFFFLKKKKDTELRTSWRVCVLLKVLMSVLKLAARFIASAARSEMELAALAVVFLTLGPACAGEHSEQMFWKDAL